MKIFQKRVTNWVIECLGFETSQDKKERANRFFEEAIELYQSCGMERTFAIDLVNYVFNRPIGEVKQEVGGVMVTLASLCSTFNLDLAHNAYLEIERCEANIKKIRAKHENKPRNSPLPGDYQK